MIIKFEHFSCCAECNNININSYWSACNQISYEFESGGYLLKGEIDCGAWGFVCSISNNCKNKIIDFQSFYINNEKVTKNIVTNLACYINMPIKKKVLERDLFHELLYILRKNKSSINVNELLEEFEFPKHLINRKISMLGDYYIFLNAMRGIIEGKKVFTTGWIGQYGFDDYLLKKIFNVLDKYGYIFIIPSSEKNIFTFPTKEIKMNELFSNEDVKKKYGDL